MCFLYYRKFGDFPIISSKYCNAPSGFGIGYVSILSNGEKYGGVTNSSLPIENGEVYYTGSVEWRDDGENYFGETWLRFTDGTDWFEGMV